MARIAWDQVGTRFYEAGVDRGVLDVNDVVVPWSGLTSVTDRPDKGTPNPYYIDGFKYSDEGLAEEFSGNVSALTYPDEFEACMGSETEGNGLYIEQQPRAKFNLSYRTMIGSDTTDSPTHYKIHFLYGVRASPSVKGYESLSDDADPTAFSWDVTTLYSRVADRRPFSHLILDSRKTDPQRLSDLEDILYGTASTDPRFPSAQEVVFWFGPEAWVSAWTGTTDASTSTLVDGMTEELLRTNLAQNPKFVTTVNTEATPIARRNLILNPSYEIDLADWSFHSEGSGAVSAFRVSSGYPGAGIGFVHRTTVDTATDGFNLAPSLISVTEGNWIASQRWHAVATDLPANATINLVYSFRDSTMTNPNVVVSDAVTPIADAENGLIFTLVKQVPVGYDQVLVYTQFDADSGDVDLFAVGKLFWTDSSVTEEFATEDLANNMVGKPSFDGSYTGDENLQVRWTGTPYLSISEAYVKGLAYPDANVLRSSSDNNELGPGTGNAWALQSENPEVATLGDYSIVIIPQESGNDDTYVNVTNHNTGSRYLQAGNTYRISADIHIERAHTSDTHSRARTISIICRNSGDTGDLVKDISPAGANTDDTTTRVSVTTTINPAPTTGIGGFIRLYNGSSDPDEPVWWDRLLIEDITTETPVQTEYFDGDSYPSPV